MSQREILNATVAAPANSISVPLDINQGIYIHAVVAVGITVATFKLQSSPDGTNWVDVPSSSQVKAANVAWNINDAIYPYVRVDISAVTGSGNVTITADTKVELG